MGYHTVSYPFIVHQLSVNRPTLALVKLHSPRRSIRSIAREDSHSHGYSLVQRRKSGERSADVPTALFTRQIDTSDLESSVESLSDDFRDIDLTDVCAKRNWQGDCRCELGKCEQVFRIWRLEKSNG